MKFINESGVEMTYEEVGALTAQNAMRVERLEGDIYRGILLNEEERALAVLAYKKRMRKPNIISKIRARYSLDDELSIQRQKDSKPDEWAAYNAYCEECKTRARLMEL